MKKIIHEKKNKIKKQEIKNHTRNEEKQKEIGHE